MGDPGTFRNAVSGFNKADVLAYIDSMNERASAEEKTFKRKYAELAESRDRLAQKLQLIESLKDNPEGKYLDAQKEIEALKGTIAKKEKEIAELKNALNESRSRQGGGSDGAVNVQQSSEVVNGLKSAIAQRDTQIANLTRALNESKAAAQSQDSAAAPQAPSPDVANMQAQLAKAKAILQEMQSRLTQKDAEIAKLNNSLEESKKETAEAPAATTQPDPNMQAQLMKAKVIIQEMQSRLVQKESEITKLNDALAESKKAETAPEPTPESTPEQQQSDPNMQAQLMKAKIIIQEMQNRLAQKDSEITTLNNSLAESKQAAEASASEQPAQTDANVQEVLIQAKKIIDKLKSRISEDEQTIARLNAELEGNSGQATPVDYAPQMAQAQSIIEELQNRLASNEAELNQTRGQFELAARELEAVRAQTSVSQDVQDKLNSNEYELNQARNQLELAGRELEVLRNQAASLQEAQNRLAANELELDQTRGQLEFARRELEVFNARTAELQDTQNQLASKDMELNQIRSQLEFAGRELEVLNAKAAELQETRNQLTANELELNQTRSQLELAGRELEVLGAQAAALQEAQNSLTSNELELKQVRSQLEFAGREIEVLNAKAAELQESKNKLLEAQVAINQMQISLKNNDKEINNLKLLLDSKEEQAKDLRQKAAALSEEQKKVSRKMAYDSLKIELGSVFVEAQATASSILDKAKVEANRISSQSKKSVLDLLRDLSLVQSEMSNIKKSLSNSASVVTSELERAGGKLETVQKNLLAQTKTEQADVRSDFMGKELETAQKLKGILDDHQTKGSVAIPAKNPPVTKPVMPKSQPQFQFQSQPRPQFQFQSQTPAVQPKPQFQFQSQTPVVQQKPQPQFQSQAPAVQPKPQPQFQSQAPAAQPKPQQKSQPQPRTPQPKTPGSFSEYFNQVEQEIDNTAPPSMGSQFKPAPKPGAKPEVSKIVGGFNINPKIFVSPKKPANPYDNK